VKGGCGREFGNGREGYLNLTLHSNTEVPLILVVIEPSV